MERKRLLLIGTLALALAFVVSVLAFRVLRVAFASTGGATTDVVVAAVDLDVGAQLKAEDVRTVKMTSTELPDGAYRTAADVVGRGVIVPMARGELVLARKLAGEGSGAGLPALIKPGMRAVSVKVNDVVAVAGFATPGTHVDVLLTGNADKSNDPEKVMTTTVLRNVEVLAAGQKIQRNSQGQAETVPVITLLVSPEDAQKLTLASSEGRIQLSLRNPLDQDIKMPPAVQNAALYRGALPAPPPQPIAKRIPVIKKEVIPAPASVYVVEMIKGDKRDVTKF
jgi:pilus assembly protein CpaB